MKNALLRSKENYKEYRNSRYKEQPLHLGLKCEAQGRASPHIPRAESLRKAWSWFTGWQRSFCDAYNLLSRVPGKVTCWRHCATKSLERIAWESSWQLRAESCWLLVHWAVRCWKSCVHSSSLVLGNPYTANARPWGSKCIAETRHDAGVFGESILETGRKSLSSCNVWQSLTY